MPAPSRSAWRPDAAVADPRIAKIHLDEATIGWRGADVDHERKVAIFDLLEDNRFALAGDPDGGPYHLRLAIEERRLVFDVRDEAETPRHKFGLSLTPLRRVLRDYFHMVESYHQAIRTATPSRIEAIDMGRRGVHDEGSRILKERLDGKIEVDHDTARRLFTLICVLHIKV
jgi:uncharacterized protein (UPF0262 family)